MNIPNSYIVSSEDETTQLAAEFSGILKAGNVVVLNGSLGTGKTFFIKKVLSSFNITGVNSPSFAIVNEYNNQFRFIHFDFYRIKKIEELYDIGINDYFNTDNSIIFIEWGELFPEVLPKKRIEIRISMIDDLKRELIFKKYE